MYIYIHIYKFSSFIVSEGMLLKYHFGATFVENLFILKPHEQKNGFLTDNLCGGLLSAYAKINYFKDVILGVLKLYHT